MVTITAFVRRRAVRGGMLGLAGAGAIAALAIIGAGHGYPAQNVQLQSGSAWLASAQVGQVTLMDGASAEVAAQVQVAPPGHALQVVQQGSTAYAIDQTTGTLRRIDGATFDLSQPQAPIPGARAGLTAFAGPSTVYALDTERGLFATADPHTLVPAGPPVSLAAQLSAGSAALDDAGRLWVIDNSTGDLSWVSGGQRHTERGVAQPGRSLLTMVNGSPVIVDTTGRRAVTVAPDSGAVTSALDLDLRPGDAIQVSGSPHAQRLYIVANRGVLDICDLAGDSCNTVVPLDSANNDLGAAIEAGNRLFVPNYSTGQVWIIDLTHPAVIGTAKVLGQPGKFQLLTRDGIVFFNDPNSAKAGVIGLDGGVTQIAKYDPANPTKGLHGNNTALPNNPPAPAGSPATTLPNQPPPATSPPQPQPPTGAPATSVPQPPANPGGGAPPTSNPTSAPPAAPVLTLKLSDTHPSVNENVGLQVLASTGVPSTAHWDFGDGQQADGVSTTHHWTAAQTYQVSVQATMPDGQQATASVSVPVSPPLPVTVPNEVGRPEAIARSDLTSAGLVVTSTTAPSNTVPNGDEISQNPVGGSTALPGSPVAITISTGKPAPIDLQATASGAAWVNGSGKALTFPGNDGDANGFALIRSGSYSFGGSGSCVLEDGSAPTYLETHPEWITNGSITGTYTLTRPVIAGDHFSASVGFIKCANLGQAGDVYFIVNAYVPGTGWVQVTKLHATGADNVMHPLNVDLTSVAGATKVQLMVQGNNSQDTQDWAAWVNPRIGG